ncbi:hypothetical protein LJ737_26675, partial [Hymenobacter sp. 15J16-1T3B]|uniref:hypothetical protein n=1 Tax=Hymenobacter sp. 15J16-1T3B TaxID=2886941 RepID=UPI001D108D22
HRHRQADDLLEVEPPEDTPVDSTGAEPAYSTALVPSQPPASFLPAISNSGSSGRLNYLQQWREEEETRKREQQRKEELARAQQAHQYYEEAIEAFLYWEGQKLPDEELEKLLVLVLDGLEHYKSHPQLKEPGSEARLRLNDLRDAALVLRDTWQEAQGRIFTGYKASYELPKKWRKQLRERLLE